MLDGTGIHAEAFIFYRKVSHRILGQEVRFDGIDLRFSSTLQGGLLGSRQLREYREGILPGSIWYSELCKSRGGVLLKVGYDW